MKILVVQMLRLGDVLAQESLIRAIDEKYPNARIDLLINDTSEGAKEFFPLVRKFWIFPRQSLQLGVGQPQFAVDFSYQLMDQLIKDVNHEQYDLTINLTQTHLSAYVLGLIDCKNKIGMTCSEEGQLGFNELEGSSWFKHLNSYDQAADTRLHYIDIFKRALRIEGNLFSNFDKPVVKKTSASIFFQTLTSDEKKNWNLDGFFKVIRDLSFFLPNYKFVILSSPNDKIKLEEWLQKTGLSTNHQVQLLICDLSQAFAGLKQADLLVTVDTSIKHLAVMANTPVFEIAVGSSDFRATGAYQQDALVISSQEFCQPCSHSRGCSRDKFYCHESIRAENMTQLILAYLDKDWRKLRSMGSRLSHKVRIDRVVFSEQGDWSALKLEDTKRVAQYKEAYNEFESR